MAYRITEKCVGCTLCAKGCPQGAIEGKLKEAHQIDPGRCIDCGYCGKVCGVGAIVDDQGQPTVKIPKAEWKKPKIERSVCVGCSVCVENCPGNCLEIEGAKYHGDIDTIAVMVREKDCIGCEICKKVCPIDAISFD